MQIKQSAQKIRVNIGNFPQKNCFSRWIILLSLPTFLFLGVFGGYMGIIDFKVHFHSLLMIGAIYLIYLLFVKHNAYYAVCKFGSNLDTLEDELAEYINNNQLILADKTKSNAPFDNFMEEFTQNLRNDNFASVATGLFPTLGILGTFISIALSMPNFSSGNEHLELEITKLLSGVGTAFYVSIYGIFLSLWWLFFEKSGMSSFEKMVFKIKERTKRLFWSKEEIEQVHFVKSMENFEHLNSVFEKITANEFIDNLQNILQQRVDLFESVIHHEQQVLQKTTTHFKEITKDIEHYFQKGKDLNDGFEQISLSFSHMANQMEVSTKLLRETLGRLDKKEDSLLTTQELLDQNLRELRSQKEKIKKKIVEPRIIDNR